MLAGNAIIHSGNEDAKNNLLPGIASGETIATLALAEASGRWDADGIAVEASGTGDGATIHKTTVKTTQGDLVVIEGSNATVTNSTLTNSDANGLIIDGDDKQFAVVHD